MKKAAVFIILLLCVLVPATGHCVDARIDEVDVRWGHGPLTVSFRVKDAFTKDIEEAVKSGIPTSFTFLIELDRVNSLWPDEEVGSWEFKHTVKYDTIKEEYEIRLDEAGQASIRTKDFGEMKRIMATGASIAITPAHLVSGAEYEVRIKAELHTIDLPFPLSYMFFFVKLLDFETGWYSHRFSP
ncbi:MAG: DUF4390 domain-containing protein [Deltaproteobacteria bacterium]|nr:DUF4390 domain-containing protein [Deltaproteobacteria bacterium]